MAWIVAVSPLQKQISADVGVFCQRELTSLGGCTYTHTMTI